MAKNQNLNTKRVTLTIPSETLQQIDQLGSLMDISRSSLVSMLVQELAPTMLSTLKHCLDEPELPLTPASSRRATVKTQEFLKNEISALTTQFYGLSDQILGDSNNEH